jgi:hypothetical protein
VFPMVKNKLTLYFSRSSLLRGALMIVRRTLEGAPWWALRDFLLEEWRAGGKLTFLL